MIILKSGEKCWCFFQNAADKPGGTASFWKKQLQPRRISDKINNMCKKITKLQRK